MTQNQDPSSDDELDVDQLGDVAGGKLVAMDFISPPAGATAQLVITLPDGTQITQERTF